MEQMVNETAEELLVAGDVGPDCLPEPGTYLQQGGVGSSVEERIEKLYISMSADRRLLDAVLTCCREPRTFEEVAEAFDRAKGTTFSMYDAMGVCNQLLKVGALVRKGNAVSQPRIVVIDGIEYLEPVSGEAAGDDTVTYQITEGGVAFLTRRAMLGTLDALLEEDGRYEQVYRILLECCANDGGASAKEMGEMVDGLPELQEPRMFASYFFNKMAECGFIEWTGTWCATELGRKAIAQLDGRDA